MAYLVRWPFRRILLWRGCRGGQRRWHRSGCRLVLWLLMFCAWGGASVPLRGSAAPPGTSAAARREAIESIPLGRLTESAQAKILSVVSRPSIYRRLPITVIESDPDLYLFLIRHPEVVVSMWEFLGVTKVKVQRSGDYLFDATDSSGTTCRVELIYGDQNTHILYAEGQYEGPLLGSLIRGSCVLALRSEYAETTDRSVHITNRLDMFLHFENVGAEILAKTLHTFVGRAADHNFVESTRFLGQVSGAAEKKAAAMQQLAVKLPNLEPDIRREFAQHAARVKRRASVREASRLVPHATSSGTVNVSERNAVGLAPVDLYLPVTP